MQKWFAISGKVRDYLLCFLNHKKVFRLKNNQINGDFFFLVPVHFPIKNLSIIASLLQIINWFLSIQFWFKLHVLFSGLEEQTITFQIITNFIHCNNLSYMLEAT